MLRSSVITSTLPDIGYAGAMAGYLSYHKAFRKEDRIKAILAARGDHPGLVHGFSAMESCTAYRPWHDKQKGHTTLKPTSGKCLHYYFYFIDESFGLCYVRMPTWAPFRLQVYFNGHHWVAQRLVKAGIAFEVADNTFLRPDRFHWALPCAQPLRGSLWLCKSAILPICQCRC